MSMAVLLTLNACAVPLNMLARFYDNQDQCLSKGQENYQYPSWCGASKGTTYVTRDYSSGAYLTTTRVQR
jgi:hypothetical protein